MVAPVSHGIMRPLNSMIGVPGLIGPAANNPTPLIRDLRFCHSCFRRFSLISSSFYRSHLAVRDRCEVSLCNAPCIFNTLPQHDFRIVGRAPTLEIDVRGRHTIFYLRHQAPTDANQHATVFDFATSSCSLCTRVSRGPNDSIGICNCSICGSRLYKVS